MIANANYDPITGIVVPQERHAPVEHSYKRPQPAQKHIKKSQYMVQEKQFISFFVFLWFFCQREIENDATSINKVQ